MSETPQDAGERDLAALAVRAPVKAAAALSGMSGTFALLGGLQFTTSGSFVDATLNLVPWSLAGLGAAQLGLALLVMRNHYPATIAASVLNMVVALVASGWAVLAASSGFLSCMAMVAPALAAAAALATPFALGPARRAHLARQRLRDDGLDLGL
jgi:hypothetical protein